MKFSLTTEQKDGDVRGRRGDSWAEVGPVAGSQGYVEAARRDMGAPRPSAMKGLCF